jgi:hypothetical protein
MAAAKINSLWSFGALVRPITALRKICVIVSARWMDAKGPAGVIAEVGLRWCGAKPSSTEDLNDKVCKEAIIIKI